RPGVQVGVPEGRGGAPANPQGGGRGRQAGPPAGPTPRNADGRAIFSTPGKKGVWLPGGGGATTPNAAGPTIPFQPWARAVYADRGEKQLQAVTHSVVECGELPDLQKIFIFDMGGPHTYRVVYMDGRSHPANLTPTFYGHSIGWWEGDTLNVETTGYNEGFWIDRRGLPTTDKLRTLEKFTRTDSMTV